MEPLQGRLMSSTDNRWSHDEIWSQKCPIDLKQLLTAIPTSSNSKRPSTATDSRKSNPFLLDIEFLETNPDLQLSYPFPKRSSSLRAPLLINTILERLNSGQQQELQKQQQRVSFVGTGSGVSKPWQGKANGDNFKNNINNNYNNNNNNNKNRNKVRNGKKGRKWRSNFLHPLDSPPSSPSLPPSLPPLHIPEEIFCTLNTLSMTEEQKYKGKFGQRGTFTVEPSSVISGQTDELEEDGDQDLTPSAGATLWLGSPSTLNEITISQSSDAKTPQQGVYHRLSHIGECATAPLSVVEKRRAFSSTNRCTTTTAITISSANKSNFNTALDASVTSGLGSHTQADGARYIFSPTNWPYASNKQPSSPQWGHRAAPPISTPVPPIFSQNDRQERLSYKTFQQKREFSVASSIFSVDEVREIIRYKEIPAYTGLNMNTLASTRRFTRIRRGSKEESLSSAPAPARRTETSSSSSTSSSAYSFSYNQYSRSRAGSSSQSRGTFLPTINSRESTQAKPADSKRGERTDSKKSKPTDDGHGKSTKKQAKEAEIKQRMKQGAFFNDSDSESGEEDNYEQVLQGKIKAWRGNEDFYEDDGRWHLPSAPPNFPSRTQSQGTRSTISSIASEELKSPISPSTSELRYYRENTAFALTTPMSKRRKRRRTASSECLLVEAVEGLRTMMLDLGDDNTSVIVEDDEDVVGNDEDQEDDTYGEMLRAPPTRRRGPPLYMSEDPGFIKGHMRFKSIETLRSP